MLFKDRQLAGKKLAKVLKEKNYENPIIFGLARGGVIIASEIAKELNATLDVLVVRKLGVPMQPEVGFGAIAPGGILILDNDIIDAVNISEREIDLIRAREEIELSRRIKKYRKDRPFPKINNRTVIIADDGIATGITTKVAIRYVRTFNPSKVIIAVPVCSSEAKYTIGLEATEVLCLYEPPFFNGVGQFYENFEQVSDEEVINKLVINNFQ
jgi:putative phosphoribosyl transferase